MIKGTKRPGVFNFVSLGDLHLGHHQTTTSLMLKNLDKYCTNEHVLADVDLLIITGDIYDRLLHNADDNVHLIHRWITRLLYLCANLDVKLRIVEGTPSHDRKQSRFFTEQKENANIPVDLHYATTLSIETIDHWGLTFLYVPDKWRNDTEDTRLEVQALLHERGLDKVDYAIMHGAFEYQLPDMVKEPTHDSAFYLAIVRYFILIGHIHFTSQYERILAAGSFDRHHHGEEGAKGFFQVSVRGPDDYRVVFKENKGARRYTTIDCRQMDTKQANVAVRRVLKDTPPGSAVRLHCERHSPVLGDMEAFKAQYPDVEWSTPKVEGVDKTTKASMDSVLKMDVDSFEPITPTSIMTLVADELQQHAPDAATVTRLQHRLKEFI